MHVTLKNGAEALAFAPLSMHAALEGVSLPSSTGIVLAAFVEQYVTWTAYLDDDGRYTCEGGHYFATYAEALADFAKRI